MSKIDEICKYLDAKFSSDGKIQSDINELFVLPSKRADRVFNRRLRAGALHGF